ncbi:hypothetical protein ID866_8789 [Astraeus odoratus]|nr:hypothetical protein ID866_8789 [Astraeus odoratus]
MSTTESLTQRWLRQNVSSYPHQDRVFVDIDAVLGRFTALRPKSDVYTYDDGRTQLLLCVHGLLPICFRGTTYNIPIAVWITRDYPRKPPIAYVVPNQDMLVRPSRYVDVSGRCDIDYVQAWERKSEGCNLSALLEAMQDYFSRSPPLYAKPSPRPAPQSGPSVSSPTPRPPSLHPPPSQSSSPALPRDVDRPTLPPKPISSPSPITTQSMYASPQSDLPSRPPPVPPPPQYQRRPAHFSQGLHAQDGNFTPSVAAPFADLSATSTSNYRGSPNAPSRLIPTADSSTHVRLPASPVPPVPPQPFTQPLHTPPRPPQPWAPAVVTPMSRSPPPNLIDEELANSSVPQPNPGSAPPRPPNPELLQLHARVHDKIQSEFASLSQAMQMDAERLRAQQTDLLAGEPAIRDEMARLEAVRDVCRNVSSRFQSTVEQAERNLSELRRKGDPEVDELVCSTSIVHNQLINLVAEDNAIEDTVYHLHRALNAGRIDLERFLRTTRVLAEEQFMKRALIEKIQQGIPMQTTLSYS